MQDPHKTDFTKLTFVPEILHSALKANQMHVPALKAQLASRIFLIECRERQVFLLHMDQTRNLHLRRNVQQQ